MSQGVIKLTPADPAAAVPRQLGRYTLQHLVAHGGMASVYLARLASTQGFRKWLAVKVIHSHVAADPDFVKMFLHEAQLAARIDHPNVCPVYDFGEVDGTYYIAMEFMLGEPLSEVFRQAWKTRGLPPDVAARIIADAAHGLHAAHELRTADGAPAEVVHRDVSPQNIAVLYNGLSKVLDFGIARSNDRTGVHTATGELKGKVAYMSPEQLHFTGVDRRTDVWALGVVLWEATVGERLFKRDTEPLTILAVMTQRVPKPSEVLEGYPGDLEMIVMKALERDPAQRYQTARELARDLEGFLARRAVVAGPTVVQDFMDQVFRGQRSMREKVMLRYDAEMAPPVLPARTSSSGTRTVTELGAGDAPRTRSGSGGNGAAWLRVAGAVVLVAVGVAGGVALTRGRGSSAARGAEASAASALRGAGGAQARAGAGLEAPRAGGEEPRPALEPARSPGTQPQGALDTSRVPELHPEAGLERSRGHETAARGGLERVEQAEMARHEGLEPSRFPTTAQREGREPSVPRRMAQSGPLERDVGVRNASAGTLEPSAVVRGASAGATEASRGDRSGGLAPRTGRERGSSASPSALAGTGYLNLIHVPSVEVFEGRSSLGFTPLVRHAMSSGRHTLRLVSATGATLRSVSVQIRPGETVAERVP